MSAFEFDLMREPDFYELYGVSNGSLHKFAFNYSDDTMSVLISNASKVQTTELHYGSLFKIGVTSDFVVVSCANCPQPGVYFYDKDLK